MTRIAPTFQATALAATLAIVAPAAAAPTPTTNPVYVCSGKITSSLRSYTEDFLHAVAGCRVKLLASPNDSCAGNLHAELANLADDLRHQIVGCSAEAERALCPLEAKTIQPALLEAIVGDASSVKASLATLVDELFAVPYGEDCPRPAPVVSTGVRECASRIAQNTEKIAEQLEQCFFSCERANLIAPNREPCVDDITGDAVRDSVVECVADKTNELDDIANRCDDAEVAALGCPLGERTVDGLVRALGRRLTGITQRLSRGVFHADCQANLPGQPTEAVPALVTLEPRLIQKELRCGQVIDGAFLEGNKRVSFDTDLDCGPVQTATDGIVVARSGITLSGRLKTRSIRGPRRSSLRTGAGIRLLPGVSRVQIVNFKAIESFGVGIEDAEDGKNKKLVIRKSTVRRNVQAGIRLRSPRARIEQVTADKNGIGFDLAGDDTRVKGSFAKGSLYEPKIGIRLGGVDKNLDGRAVTLNRTTVEQNQGTGVEIVEGPHFLTQNTVRENLGDGILIEPAGSGSYIDSSIVKMNARGIVVLGDANRLESNTCEENLGPGFVVAGIGNVLEQNKSGKKTDRGNAGPGYEIVGEGTRLYTNQAEANHGSGFVLQGTTSRFKGNTAKGNDGIGFDVQSPGNPIENCAAEANSGFEWTIAAGNLDRSGNRANGKTFSIPASGGVCESGGVCQ